MKHEFRNRWTGAVIHTEEIPDSPNPTRTALEQMAIRGRDPGTLRKLRELTIAELDDDDEDVSDAERKLLQLRAEAIDQELGKPSDRARLDGARLDGARLDRARLDGASLDGASLVGASLDGASLVGASLDGARLVGASLDGARLDRASLVKIRDDFRAVLDRVPAEVLGLLAKLRGGEIDGSCYEGACACLVGTIAIVRGVSYHDLDALRPNAGRPAERWFLALQPGHTPQNHPVAAITEQWIGEWLTDHGIAVPPRPKHLDADELAELRTLLGDQLGASAALLLAKLGWAPPPAAAVLEKTDAEL